MASFGREWQHIAPQITLLWSSKTHLPLVQVHTRREDGLWALEETPGVKVLMSHRGAIMSTLQEAKYDKILHVRQATLKALTEMDCIPETPPGSRAPSPPRRAPSFGGSGGKPSPAAAAAKPATKPAGRERLSPSPVASPRKPTAAAAAADRRGAATPPGAGRASAAGPAAASSPRAVSPGRGRDGSGRGAPAAAEADPEEEEDLIPAAVPGPKSRKAGGGVLQRLLGKFSGRSGLGVAQLCDNPHHLNFPAVEI